MDVASQVLVADVLAQLTGVKGHFEGDVHACRKVAFHRLDGEVGFEALGVPFKPFQEKTNSRGRLEKVLPLVWNCT